MKNFISRLFTEFNQNEEFQVSTDAWTALSKEVSLPLTETFNLLGTLIAKMYAKRDLNYEFCDALVNIAFSDWLAVFEESNDWPTDFYEVYEAFDAGEYYRTDDKSDDPIADYTDPFIREFIERVNSNA